MSPTSQLKSAISSNDNETVSKLLEKMDIEAVNRKKGNAALNLACSKKNQEALDSLLALAGIDVNVKDSNTGWTPLYTSVVHDNLQTVTKLLDRPEIDVNAKSSYGGATPLHLACRKNLHLIVRKLLASPGIEVNAKDDGGDTPIMDCALLCIKDALNVMLDDPRVNLDIKDKNGKGLEEKVGAFGYSKEKKDTCLEMIKNERMRRGNGEVVQEQTSQAGSIVKIEKINTGSIVKIEKINKKIVMEEENSYKNLDVRKRKMEDLIEKQTLDKKLLVQKHKEESSLMEKYQRREITVLKESLDREYHDEQRYIASLKEHRDELAQENEKPNNDDSSQELSKLDPIKRSFECPVCMEKMRPPTKIWMCRFSHIICEVCKDNLKAEGGNCPTCTTEPFIGRNYVVEDLARTVFNEYPSKSKMNNPLRSTTGTRNISSPIPPVIQEGSSRDSVASTGSVEKKRRKLGRSQVSSI